MVTMVRILTIPVLVVLMSVHFGTTDVGRWVCAAIFVLIALTDSLDGYLARSRGEVTTFGKFMDPIADKLMVIAVMVQLVQLGALPAFIPVIVAAREFLVSGLRMVCASAGVVIAASIIGKAKTLVTMAAIFCFIVKDTAALSGLQPGAGVFSWTLMWAAVVLTVVSMVDYFRSSAPILLERPAFSRPKDGDAGVPLSKPFAGRSSTSIYVDEETSRDGAQSALSGVSSPDSRAPSSDMAPLPDWMPSAGGGQPSISKAATRLVARSSDLGIRLATAESLTGGLISATLTSVPGSSYAVAGGIVSYMVDVKESVLRVSPATIETEGVVSEETASQMALGALDALNADVAAAVTGVAGPGGGTAQTPVGTVCLSVAVRGRGAMAETRRFDGDREQVRTATVARALELLDYGVSECAKSR